VSFLAKVCQPSNSSSNLAASNSCIIMPNIYIFTDARMILIECLKIPVLLCRTRSAYFAILYLAITEGRSCSWALDTSRSIGYDFSSPSYPLCRVITSFQEGEHDESMQMSEAPVQNVFFVTGRYSLPVCSSQPSLKTLTLTQTPTPTQMLVQTPTQPPTPTYTLTPKQTRLGEYKYRKLLYANNIHMWQLTTDMPLIKII
jgi:hypothetical protein